jgi:hypothetical protein
VTVEKEIHKEPIINEIIKETHIPVEIMKPYIVNQEKPVEIPIEVPHFIKEEIPVFIKEENTYPVPIIEERIRIENEIKEKVIEKIVEVPRTVTV